MSAETNPERNFLNLMPNGICYRNSITGQEHHWPCPVEPARLTFSPKRQLHYESDQYGIAIVSPSEHSGIVGLPEVQPDTNIIVSQSVANFMRSNVSWGGVVLVPDIDDVAWDSRQGNALLVCSRFVRQNFNN